jgi:hypothetical protein
MAIEATPAAIVYLQRQETDQPGLRPLHPDEFPLDPLISMNFQEARHFLHLIQKSQAVPDFPHWLDNWQARERELLLQLSGEIPCWSLELPMHYAPTAAFRRTLVENLAGLIPGATKQEVYAKAL